MPQSSVTIGNSELCFCAQPEKKDECVFEVCLPPEESALEGGEEKSEEGEDGMKKRGVGAMVKIFHFVMKQSYICALIAMMVSNAAHRWCHAVTEAGLCCICVIYLKGKHPKSLLFVNLKVNINKLLKKDFL